MTALALSPYRIAAVVPCHNEELTVAKVVADLKAAVPGITVFVYDNCSTDATVEVARAAGAVVCHEPRKGKGNVVRRAFADIEADIYLLIDGDDTYDASAAPLMIQRLLLDNLDQVVGVRRATEESVGAYRPNHEAGNKALNEIVRRIFGDSHGDMLSGYRIFSRRFVKSFPAVSREFEIETELTVHSLACRLPSATVEVDFRERPEGSESKLRTYHDGMRILRVIVGLARHERPVLVNGMLAGLLMVAAAAIGTPVLVEYAQTGFVPRVPSLVASGVLALAAMLFLGIGVSLDATRKARHESSRLSYLTYSAVRSMINGPQDQALITAEHGPGVTREDVLASLEPDSQVVADLVDAMPALESVAAAELVTAAPAPGIPAPAQTTVSATVQTTVPALRPVTQAAQDLVEDLKARLPRLDAAT